MTDLRDVAMGAIIAIALVVVLFLVTGCQAQAQYAPTYRSKYRPVGEWHEARHRHTRKVWRDHQVYEDHCKAPLATVGDQYASENGAKQEADKAWMQTARWQHGERYMARENAEDATYECGRSSVGSVAGQIFIRCRLTARPCRPEPKGD